MSEPNIVEESSSNEEGTIPTINTGPSVCPSSPESQCSVCLDELTNPSHTDSCLHSFCFECIQRWSHSKHFCPLCKATFNYIYHSFDDMGVHKTYVVYRTSADESSSDDDSDGTNRTRRMPLPAELVDNISNHSFPPIFGQTTRMLVYSNNLWVEPLQDTNGRIRDCSLDFYRNNPLQMVRLQLFILRDIIAARECLRISQARPMVNETIMIMARCVMQSLLNCEIRQLHMIHNIMHFLDVHAVHFCHELYNFAISSFNIFDYDSNVQYTHRPPTTESPEPLSIETIVLNSENEEVQRPTIDTNVSCNTNDSDDVNHSFCFIEPLNPASVDQPSTSTGIRDSLNQPNNNNNDSDVVIIRHIIRPTKPLNSASVDQPSTSTGIRDSLNRPSNGFQSVDGGSSSYLFRKRKERRNLDSSSDDED